MPSLNTRLYSFHAVGETGSTFFTKKAYECNAHICLSLRNGLSPREISKAAIKISNLWSIISGAWCQIRHIALHQEYESEGEKQFKTLQFCFVPPTHAEGKDKH